jgi:hypothetical protein
MDLTWRKPFVPVFLWIFGGKCVLDFIGTIVMRGANQELIDAQRQLIEARGRTNYLLEQQIALYKKALKEQ